MQKNNSKPETIDTALVVGAGIMGHGFAQLLAMNNIGVFLVDQSAELLDRARGWIEEACGEDSRSRPFQLTTDGEKVLEDAIVAWERAQAKAVDLLGKEGVALLHRATKNVRARVSAE